MEKYVKYIFYGLECILFRVKTSHKNWIPIADSYRECIRYDLWQCKTIRRGPRKAH